MSNLFPQNNLVSSFQLLNSPSKKDNINKELETELRYYSCELIQSIGILLNLPQKAISLSQVILNSLYFIKSLFQESVMGSIFLASKVEEEEIEIKHIINAFDYIIKTKRNIKFEPITSFSKEFYRFRDDLLKGEMIILRSLGFKVHIELPYGLMINYLKLLELDKKEEIRQLAWSYLNDSMRITINLYFKPNVIASGIIYLVSKIKQIDLPQIPFWAELFDTTESECQIVAQNVLFVYTIKAKNILPINNEELNLFLKSENDFLDFINIDNNMSIKYEKEYKSNSYKRVTRSRSKDNKKYKRSRSRSYSNHRKYKNSKRSRSPRYKNRK